ncbi:SufE family protein [Sessilibacter sp. MAH4]
MIAKDNTHIICKIPDVDLIELKNQKNWQRKYKSIIDLSKKLPSDDIIKQDQYLVAGCEAKTWLHLQLINPETIEVTFDSESAVVKGLCCVVLAPINDKKISEIGDFNLHDYMHELQLEKHLSPSRVNGLLSFWVKLTDFVSSVRSI